MPEIYPCHLQWLQKYKKRKSYWMKKEAFSIKIKTPLVRFLIYLYLLEFYMDLLLMSYIETYVLHVTVSGMSNLKQNFVFNFLAIHNVKVRKCSCFQYRLNALQWKSGHLMPLQYTLFHYYVSCEFVTIWTILIYFRIVNKKIK